MAQDRRPYRREGQERRREALISAAIDLISEGGPQAATVRAIADRAGVTPGLITHYFQTKEDLTQTAYATVMERLNAASNATLNNAPGDPAARLAAFVAGAMRPPVLDPVAAGIWAGLLQQIRNDPALRAVHLESYQSYRGTLQSLIAALPGNTDAAMLRARTIGCNAVIDGLWLEGSMLPDHFGPGELEKICLSAIGAIVGIDLMAALPGYA